MITSNCKSRLWAILISLSLLTLVACAGISSPRTEFALPRQEVSSLPPDGVARVIFYNGPEGGTTIDGADKVNIYVEDRAVAGLRKWEYVVVDLEPRDYEVRLIHNDLANFRSGHVITLKPGVNWVKVYSTLTANELRQMEVPQPNFEARWKAAPIRR